jgi:hypothetical protein
MTAATPRTLAAALGQRQHTRPTMHFEATRIP